MGLGSLLRRALAAAALALAAASAPAGDAAVRGSPPLWTRETGGAVLAIARSGATVYAAGGFQVVGPHTGGAVVVDAATGAPVRETPRVDDVVFEAAPDGHGGWFVVAGGCSPEHLRADGTVDRAWRPAHNGCVEAIAVGNGAVYVGGSFTRIGGVDRRGIAALDPVSGSVTPWNPDATAPGDAILPVAELAVAGSTVIAGGEFWRIGGKARNGLAALDAATGKATAWDPRAVFADAVIPIHALAVAGSRVYVAGEFDEIGGKARGGLAALDATTGAALPWAPEPRDAGGEQADVEAIAVSGRAVYVVGGFERIGGRERRGAAALDAGTGAASAWDARLASAPGRSPEFMSSVAVAAGTVYLAGAFTTAGGAPRLRFAALDDAGGSARAWTLNADNYVHCLAVAGSRLFVGGAFTSAGGSLRSSLTALGAATGALRPWSPRVEGGVVSALAVAGGVLYAGGDFTRIDGERRTRLAAFDLRTGRLTPWSPGADGHVRSLAIDGRTVYVGGAFHRVGGVARRGIAAVDRVTGRTTPWNPQPTDPVATPQVNALAVARGTVYAGGLFSRIGGAPRANVAALRATDAAATPWSPSVHGSVNAIALAGDAVYVGGDFDRAGGAARRYLAALRPSDGRATAWSPRVAGIPSPRDLPGVYTIAATERAIYIAGNFARLGGKPRPTAGAIDRRTGAATAWAPTALGFGLSVATSGSTVYAGGSAIAAFRP